LADTDEQDQAQGRGYAHERLLGFIGQRYARLRTVEAAEEGPGPAAFTIGGDGLVRRAGPVPVEFRRTRVIEFRGRLRQESSAETPVAGIASFGIPAAIAAARPPNQWTPLGPSVLRKGQAANRPAVSGRVPGIAVAVGGMRVYVASANGGVWRSDDAAHRVLL
jgi:hypothetical protein